MKTKQSVKKSVMSSLAQKLADNLNYNVLIESLKEGNNLTPSQAIILFNLATKRNSNIEKDIKNYQSPL